MLAAQQLDVAARKARLLERIDSQREHLAASGAVLEKPFALVDKVLDAGRLVKQQPWIAGAGALAITVLLRRRLFRWVGRGWTLWRGWRWAQRWLHQQGYIKN